MARKKKTLDKVVGWLIVIGALNWGLDVIGFNIVDMIANATFLGLGTLIYSLVGLSGAYALIRLFQGKYMR